MMLVGKKSLLSQYAMYILCYTLIEIHTHTKIYNVNIIILSIYQTITTCLALFGHLPFQKLWQIGEATGFCSDWSFLETKDPR